jgi:hypothetical protein
LATIDGETQDTALIPDFADGREHQITIVLGAVA